VHERRQRRALLAQLREEGLRVLLHHGVENRVLGAVAHVRGRRRRGRSRGWVRVSGPCVLHAPQ